MEGFSVVDIYDTKGTEYLFVIGYLLILVFFWRLTRNPVKIMTRIKDAVSTLSVKILKIPQGIYFSKNHTWTHLGESGSAKVGLDDFLQHVIGTLQLAGLKGPGEAIRKGELMAEIDQDGKQLRIYSPISGEIVETNDRLVEDPGIINADPYNNGWIYMVKPSNWMKETSSYLLAEKATEWSDREFIRFKDFLSLGAMRKYSSEPAMLMLQDGGEIRDNVLSELPDEIWKDFQEEFLDSIKKEQN